MRVPTDRWSLAPVERSGEGGRPARKTRANEKRGARQERERGKKKRARGAAPAPFRPDEIASTVASGRRHRLVPPRSIDRKSRLVPSAGKNWSRSPSEARERPHLWSTKRLDRWVSLAGFPPLFRLFSKSQPPHPLSSLTPTSTHTQPASTTTAQAPSPCPDPPAPPRRSTSAPRGESCSPGS